MKDMKDESTVQDYTNPRYWKGLTVTTRRYGHCYVHAPARKVVSAWEGITIDGILYRYAGWGRSLQTPKGHKYRVFAHYIETGKPVRMVDLLEF